MRSSLPAAIGHWLSYPCASCSQVVHKTPSGWTGHGGLGTGRSVKPILPILLAVVLAGCATPSQRREAEETRGIKARAMDVEARIEAWATEQRAVSQAVEDPRQTYVDAHPEMSDEVKRAIVGQRIRVGMTPEQVAVSWGKPESKNITDGAYGRREQWVYPSHQYLYFVHGKLESWSRTE